MMRTALLLSLAIGLALPVSAAPKRGLPDPVVPEPFGVNIHFVVPDAVEADTLAAGGFGFIRMDFHWSTIEKQRGEYNFADYDKLVEGMSARGIRVLFILDYGNDLYCGKGESPRTPEAWAAFARWSAAAARHYAGKGILWEIFNEPNIGFWKPKPNVEEYAGLANAVIDAVRRADPQAYIVAPASAGFPWEFFEGLGQRGVIARLDALSVHPYRSNNPETAVADYARLRALLDRYSPKRKLPILSGEWGYSTQEGGLPEETQAQYLVRQRLMNMASDVRLSIWYDWRDDGTDPKYNEHHFGTVYRDLKPKPSYLAARTLTDTLRGYRYVRRVALREEKDWLLVFSKGKSVALAAWTTGTPHTVQLPLGAATLVEMLGAKRDVVPGTEGLEVALSPSPQYLLLAPSQDALRLASWAPTEAMVTVRAGTEARLAVRLSNVSKELLTGALRVAGAPAAVKVSLAQGTQSVVNLPLRVDDRSRESRTIVVEFTGSGPRALQRSALYVHLANSLRLEVLPPAGNTATARLISPSGEALRGTVQVAAGSQTARQAFALQAGQTEAEVVVKLPGAVTPGTPVSCRVLDAAGKAILECEPVTWQPTAPVQAGDTWRCWTEGDPKVNGTAAVTVVPSPEPLAQPGLSTALQLDHRFSPGWRFACYNPPDPLAAIPGQPRAVGMWVYGDGSGNILRCRITDSTGQTFQEHYGGLTWKGWKFVTMSLRAEGAGYWGGANDGVIHYPLRWGTLVLVDPLEGNDDQDYRMYATGFALQQ